jgi:hypothetical protein
MSDSCVRERCRIFRDGCTDVRDEGGHGRHSIVIDELVHKVVRDFCLTEFVPSGTTTKTDVYCETLNNRRRSIQNKRRGMLTKGVVLLHDNARPHTEARTYALIKLLDWEIFDHPPSSPDLAPGYYHHGVPPGFPEAPLKTHYTCAIHPIGTNKGKPHLIPWG